jgi:hypothetical protein
MILVSWLPPEFFLMVHQMCASPGGQMLINMLSNMMEEYRKRRQPEQPEEHEPGQPGQHGNLHRTTQQAP